MRLLCSVLAEQHLFLWSIHWQEFAEVGHDWVGRLGHVVTTFVHERKPLEQMNSTPGFVEAGAVASPPLPAWKPEMDLDVGHFAPTSKSREGRLQNVEPTS